MSFSKVSLSGFSPFRYTNPLSPFPFSLPLPLPSRRVHTLCCTQDMSCSISSSSSAPQKNASTRWRPMCLYFTQGKCTMMDDLIHLERFNHDISRDLPVDAAAFQRKCSQDLDFFLVLDLEGKIEILEFPVLMIDAKTMAFVDLFHRFVRPSKMSEQHINKYIEGKYGKFGVDRVWHDTALPFKEVLKQFEAWLIRHRLWGEGLGDRLNQAAFVTCERGTPSCLLGLGDFIEALALGWANVPEPSGNWDLKTKVPDQCKVSQIKLPPYFMEWINLKDAFYNFYKTRRSEATGMVGMMKNRQIPMFGSHHLGIDDTKNIARVLQRMLADGARMQVTAWRNPDSRNVEYLYEDRI